MAAKRIKVDAGLTSDLAIAGDEARELEAMGYAGIKSIETEHDPFLPLVAASLATTNVDLITGIAVAFARSPMAVANVGHDLNAASKGRFILGLGSQIKPHIEKRYSMPWSSPAARMREFVLAMRAIWACWHEGKPLEFIGKFYRHTLMTPFFTPKNIEYGPPKVYIAAVGPLMTEVAGEVADGLLVHSFSNEAYLREVSLPALERGFAKAGKNRSDFEICFPVFSVTGRDERELKESDQKIRQQIAFYGSTPAYKGVLDVIGVGELQPELNKMSKQGRWEEMGHLIDDDVLEKFAVQGSPTELASRIKMRYGELVDRSTASYAQFSHEEKLEFIEAMHSS